MRKWTYLIVILLVVGLYYLRQNHPTLELANKASNLSDFNTKKNQDNPSPPSLEPSPTHRKVGGSQTQFPSTVTSPALPFDEELQRQVASEAEQMDHVEQSESDATKRIREIVKSLNSAKLGQLARQAVDLKVPINQRALSTYLLAEAGPQAAAELQAMIEAPLVKPGPYPPHSTDEVQSMQERSLRLMGVDGLFKAAQIDPESRRRLEEVARTANSQTIRNYAMRKLAELR